MMYRSKSASRALDELIELGHKYPDCRIQAVDNILNMQYFKDFVPNLVKQNLQLELFFEVKANLKKEQLRQLREAGVIWIQPGLESLDSSMLKRMRKGVRALQNIQLLKWCKELDITPFWNIIWGFPGESPEVYQQMAQLVPLLTHLPPGGFSTVRLDRFSPNFVAAKQLGFTNVAPYPAYHYIYPFDSQTIANLAYFFVYQYREPQDVKNYTQPLADQLKTWNKVYSQNDLLWLDRDPYLLIFDFRPIARKSLIVLTGPSRLLYLACDTTQPISRLQQLLQKHTGKEEVPSQEVKILLKPLLDQGLMIAEDNAYLSLAISLKEYVPKQAIQERYQHLLEQFDEKLGSFRFKQGSKTNGKELQNTPFDRGDIHQSQHQTIAPKK
ncbi:RiPP maturation radical SAM C-methyltransferase [Chloroflexota bacterium]